MLEDRSFLVLAAQTSEAIAVLPSVTACLPSDSVRSGSFRPERPLLWFSKTDLPFVQSHCSGSV